MSRIWPQFSPISKTVTRPLLWSQFKTSSLEILSVDVLHGPSRTSFWNIGFHNHLRHLLFLFVQAVEDKYTVTLWITGVYSICFWNIPFFPRIIHSIVHNPCYKIQTTKRIKFTQHGGVGPKFKEKQCWLKNMLIIFQNYNDKEQTKLRNVTYPRNNNHENIKRWTIKHSINHGTKQEIGQKK